MKETVRLRKQGKFYNAFLEDAFVLSFITGYKVVNGKVGFPVNSLGKVCGLLDENKINYLVIEKDVEVDKKSFVRNNYNKYLKIGRKSYDEKERIGGVINKIKNLDKEQMGLVIKYIEELCDGE